MYGQSRTKVFFSFFLFFKFKKDAVWFSKTLLSFQQAFMCVSGALSVPFLISSFICAGELPEVRAQLLSITFFMCGVATLLQNIIGIR